MQTSAIRYRVADFLKQHSPFDTVEMADLLMLAERGRVKFHESDEFIFWQGAAHKEHIFVIQQGTVCLEEKSGSEERRRDILGAGEILGLERFLDTPVYRYSAKTASDVVLYALPAADFATLLESYASLQQHLATHTAVVAGPADSAELAPAASHSIAARLGPSMPAMIGPDEPVSKAAAEMLRRNVDSLIVADPGDTVLGTLSREQLLRALAGSGSAGPSVASTEVRRWMNPQPPVITEDAPLSDALLVLAGDASAALVTRDGSRLGQLRGIVSNGDNVLRLMDDPLHVLRAIDAAESLPELAQLRTRAEAFVLSQLLDARSADWLARLSSRVHHRILRRLLALVPGASADVCWCFLGAAGRGELMTPMAPVLAAVTPDRASIPAAAEAMGRIAHAFSECGYRQPDDPLDPVLCCATLDDWTSRFDTWIGDPILSGISLARPFFDAAPLDPVHPLWQALHVRVLEQVRARPAFTALLANDCLEQLPPMTFFEDRVVEDTGQPSNVFHLQRTAIGPLADAGRVLGIAAGIVLGAPTLERLRAARQILPQYERLLLDAEQTLLVVLYHQARAGIREGDEGATIPPAALSHPERQVLKTAFRSLTQLLEVTAEWGWRRPE